MLDIGTTSKKYAIPGLHHGTSLAMKTSRYWPPCFGHGDHWTSIQDAETEEMIEFQTHAVHCPLEPAFGIKQGIAFWRQYGQVLDVPPRQSWTRIVMELFFFLNSYDVKGKFLFHFYYIYLASKARANTPAASGAAAEVPECVLVHFPYKSVVACKLFKKKGETDCLSILHSASFFFAHELVIPFCPYHDNEMSRDKRPLVTWPRVSVVLFYFLATGSRGGLFFFCTTESSMHFPFRLNFWYKAHCFLQAEKAH